MELAPASRQLATPASRAGKPARPADQSPGRRSPGDILALGFASGLKAVPHRYIAGVGLPIRRFAPLATAAQIAYAAERVRPVGGNAIRNAFTDSEALAGILADIGRAKKKIQFETFLFSGEHGAAIADALIARHREGLAVQVLLDRAGASYDGFKLADKLKAAGVDMRFYDTRRLNKPMIAVDHAKLVVVDDAIAWIGGANFDYEIARDMMTRIDGPGASQVQRVFNEGWRDSGGTVLPVARRLGRRGGAFVAVSQTGPREATTRGAILAELGKMRRGDEIKLWMMDLGDHQLIEELEAAHRRGANVAALLDPDVPFLKGDRWDALRVKVLGGAPDLYAISRLQRAGIEVRYYQKEAGITKLHGKVWLFVKNAGTARERLRVYGGSVNAILGALDINREAGVLFHGKGVGRDVRHAIARDMARHSRPIPPVGRTLVEKLKIQLVKVFTRFLV